MSLLWHEGFDASDASASQTVTTYLQRKGYSGPYSAATSRTGRTGTGLAISVSGAGFLKSFSALATVIAGCGFKITTLAAARIMSFFDASVGQLSVTVTPTGAVQVRRGDYNGTVLSETAGGQVSANTWYYFELKSTINTSTGSYEVRQDGSTILSGSSVNTDANASSQATGVQFGYGGNTTYIDDCYLCDTTGSLNNDFLGPVQSLWKPAAADSATNTGWTPSTGSDHFATVDESPANDDTDYNSAATTTLVDTYDCGDIGGSDVVLGVTTVLLARKTDAGVAQLTPTIRTNSTNYTGTTQALPDSYSYITELFETNPDTSAQWTAAEVNASELAGMTSA